MAPKITLDGFRKRYEESPYNIRVVDFDGKYVHFLCDDCGNKFKIAYRTAQNPNRQCPLCGDGVSYANKYMRALFVQLPVDEYIFEYYPSWAPRRFYDAYFKYKQKEYVVEMDGLQHSKRDFFMTVEETKENDCLKDQAAANAGVTMIRIDASKSSSDYIQSQIKQSLFNTLFDLSDIDWNKCGLCAVKSLVPEVCKYFNTHSVSKAELAEHFKISRGSVWNYLKKGYELGLCDSLVERSKANRYKAAQKTSVGHGMSKLFKAYDISTGECLGVFATLRDGQDKLRELRNNDKITKKLISQVLNGSKKSHQGMTFCYADESLSVEEVKSLSSPQGWLQVYLNGELLHSFDSYKECIAIMNSEYSCGFTKGGIAASITQGYKYKGFKFLKKAC